MSSLVGENERLKKEISKAYNEIDRLRDTLINPFGKKKHHGTNVYMLQKPKVKVPKMPYVGIDFDEEIFKDGGQQPFVMFALDEETQSDEQKKKKQFDLDVPDELMMEESTRKLGQTLKLNTKTEEFKVEKVGKSTGLSQTAKVDNERIKLMMKQPIMTQLRY